VKDEKNKQKRLEKALSTNLRSSGHDDDDDDKEEESTSKSQKKATKDDNIHNVLPIEIIKNNNDLVQSTLHAFEQEIQGLVTACTQHETELQRLHEHILKQNQLSEALTLEEDALHTEYNSLEIDARSFEHIHQQLTLQCRTADREVAALCCVQLHSTLFDITTSVEDDRGGRQQLLYPLINDLRFAHRPKGELV